MPFLERGAVRIWFDEAAPAGGEGLPVVVFTHGFASTARHWAAPVEALLRSGRYRSVVWEMRGHGRSDSPEDPACYSKLEQISDLRAVLERCGVSPQRPAVLCGHSMGGFDSLLFYCLHPELVRALVLCATGPGFAREEPWRAWNVSAEESARGFEERGLSAAQREQGHRSARGLANSSRGVMAQRVEDPLFQQLADGPLHVARNLENIRVPARIIVGERDKGFLRACEMLAAKLPDARLAKLAGAGHMAAERSPAEFNEALLRSLDELCGGARGRL